MAKVETSLSRWDSSATRIAESAMDHLWRLIMAILPVFQPRVERRRSCAFRKIIANETRFRRFPLVEVV
jgi:hypothetical protein